MGDAMRTPRSWLYVPGLDEGKLAKAERLGADALIIDLEDAVPPREKQAARALVRSWLNGLTPRRLQVWVRVNGVGEDRVKDLEAVATAPTLTGVVAAKIASAQDLNALDSELTLAGNSDAPVVPLLESGSAVLAAETIARARRVLRLQVGEVDLMADLGAFPMAQEEALVAARGLVVLASAAAGLQPPIAPVDTDFRDITRFRATTERLRAGGYVGRACIHPDQVVVANEVFTPTPEEVGRARDVLKRVAAVEGGVTLDADGRMVDAAVVRQARRMLMLLPDEEG